MNVKNSWAARLWAAKENREHAFAAVVFPPNSLNPIGFGQGEQSHRALDEAFRDVDLIPFLHNHGFNYPDSYVYDKVIGRDCLTGENDLGYRAMIVKL